MVRLLITRRRRRRRGRSSGGFTLVELLVVIAIVALVAAMAGSTMKSTRGEKAASCARARISEVNLVRQAAMTQQQPARLIAQTQLGGTVYQLVAQVWSPTAGGFVDLGATLNAPVDVQLCNASGSAVLTTASPTCPMTASFAICFLSSGASYLQTSATPNCQTIAGPTGATIYVQTVTGDKRYKLPLFGLTGMAKLKDQF